MVTQVTFCSLCDVVMNRNLLSILNSQLAIEALHAAGPRRLSYDASQKFAVNSTALNGLNSPLLVQVIHC